MDGIFLALEIIGTCAFAVSGAMAAIKKHLDVFGVLFCGIITALGGGVARDVILDRCPPTMFSNYIYLIFAASSCLITFIVATILKTRFEKSIEEIDKINNIFDAVGLGVFTVAGIRAALGAGYADNAFFVIFLGVTTGVGGGILRDICVREVPLLFAKRVYAVASIAGACVYYFLHVKASLNEMFCLLFGIAVICLLRGLASHFRWDLPRAY